LQAPATQIICDYGSAACKGGRFVFHHDLSGVDGLAVFGDGREHDLVKVT
jgi:hypothetical protein